MGKKQMIDIRSFVNNIANAVREPFEAYLRLCTDSPIAGLAVTAGLVLTVFVLFFVIRDDCRGRGSRPW
jgi:hypothetical protein